MAKFTLMMAAPKIAEMLNISFIEDEVTRFFTDVIKQTIEVRRAAKTRRNDFIDLMIDITRNSDDLRAAVPRGDHDPHVFALEALLSPAW